MELRKQKTKLSKLMKELPYDHNKNIIGDVDKDKYVQFIPVLKGYHRNGKNICVFYLDRQYKISQTLICPTCGKDLSDELCGK